MSSLSRLKQSPVIRAVLVYLGASWVVLEAADLLHDALELPDWILPVTIILLLAGLVVVAATALVQSDATTDRREAAGEVPTDWALDLPDLARSLRGGRLPHLTWGRTLAGGAAVFLLLFGLGGALVLFRGGDGALGLRELDAAPAAPGLAVLPFSVSGGELDVWREGAVDLLSRNLDGLGVIRAIDGRTVLARWREAVGEGSAPDLAATLAVARRTGARWAVVGSAVTIGARVRISADVHDLETGERLARATAEGSPDSLLTIVDQLSVEVARALLSRDDPDVGNLRVASITTSSPEALRAFLAAEEAYRRSAFAEAIEGYERAVQLDSTFALANYRLASAYGWIAAGAPGEARRRAYRHRDRLPAREALMVEAEYRARAGALTSGVALLREGVRRYPDHAEMWYQLGDIYVHWGPQLLVTPADAEAMLRRAVELDPQFGPYQIHLVDLALIRGDSAEAAERIEAELATAGPEAREVIAHRVLFDYLYGPRAGREEVVANLDTVPAAARNWLLAKFSLDGEKAGEALTLGSAACELALGTPGVNAGTRYLCLYNLIASGRITRALEHGDVMRRAGQTVMPAMVGIALRQTGMDPDAPLPDAGTILFGPAGADALISPGILVGGILGVLQGQPAIVDSAAGILDRAIETRTAAGDTLGARVIRGLAEGLHGYRALREGRTVVARERLENARDLLAGTTGPEGSCRTLLVWPLAEIYAAEGRDDEALPLFQALWEGFHAAPAILRRADIHEARGEAARAAELRRHFLSMWGGDPQHPMVREARRRISVD